MYICVKSKTNDIMKSILRYDPPTKEQLFDMAVYCKSVEEKYKKIIVLFDRMDTKGYSFEDSIPIIKRYVQMYLN